MKPLPHLLSAAGGAIVTIAVLQGSAIVFGDATVESVHVSEGQVHTVQSAGGPMRKVVRNAPATPSSAPVQLQQAAPQVTSYIAGLERDLEQAKFQNSLLEGQIAARDGVAVEWPSDLPNGLTPETFEATLRAVADDVPKMSLDRVDCSEYPCLAVLSGGVSSDDARDIAQQVQDSLERRVGEGGKLSARIGISKRDNGEGEAELSLVIAPTPEHEGSEDGDMELRLQNRFNDAMQGDDGH